MTSEPARPVQRGLIGLAAVAASLLGVLLVIGLIWTGSATELDPRILVWTRSVLGSDGPVIALAEGITAFGNDVTLWTVTILTTGYLLAVRDRGGALHMAAAAASGGLMTTAIKLLVHRPRPQIVPHLVEAHPPSFPSGHATNSAVVYGTLALIAVAAMQSPAGRRYVAFAVVLLILLIGVSRIVLGVHWPSDVLAGWVLGVSVALLGSRIAERLTTRGAVVR